MQLKNFRNLSNPFERLNLVLWQPLAGYSASLALLIGLLVYRLGTLVPGFSLGEKASIAQSVSLKTIFSDPLYAPHDFLQYLSLKSGHKGFIAMRLPSVIIAVAVVVLFFYIVTRWFNFRVAAITTFLLVTSSWFLHSARIATPEVTMLGLVAPLAYSIWLHRTKRPLPALILGAITLTTMIHIPGFIWFAIAGIFWQRKSLAKVYREAKIPAILIIFGCIIVSTPLFISVASSKLLLLTYLGLPAALPAGLADIPLNILRVPYMLILSGPSNPELNIGRLPLLDFFTSIMAVIGAYSYLNHSKLRRSKLILACLVVGTLLASFMASVSVTILLPFIFLLVAGGINFMIEQWFVVFPYNPLARNLATILIVAAVLVTAFYHLNRYFIAWPQAPATKSTFSHQP